MRYAHFCDRIVLKLTDIKVLLNELVSLYQGKELPPASSYFHQCYNSRLDVEPSRLSSLVSYLDSAPQVLDLPIDYVRPEIQTYNHGRTLDFAIDPSALSSLVDRLGTTPFACLMTAFAVALHLNAASQEDFLIGIPFANRVRTEDANAIGFCKLLKFDIYMTRIDLPSVINMLPLRVQLGDVSTLDELHSAVQRDVLFLAGLQDVPFDSLVHALDFNRSASRDALQVILNFTDAPEGSLGGTSTFSRFPLNNGTAHTDLICFVELGKDGSLSGQLEYDSAIFVHDTMESFASAFVHIIDAWSVEPSQSIIGMELSTATSHIPSLGDDGIVGMSFGAYLAPHLRQSLESQAVYDDTTQTSYTYAELISLSGKVQDVLRPLWRSDGKVVLLLERNVDAIAAMIGIALSGLAFIPCDISQPLSRITEIINDSHPVCVIAHEQVLRKFGAPDTHFSTPVHIINNVLNEAIDRPCDIVPDGAGDAA